MSKKITVVGIDPSMSNFGVAVGTLDLETDELEVHGLTLVETKAGNNKKTVRVNSDDLRRARKYGVLPDQLLNRQTWFFVSYLLEAKILALRPLTVFVLVCLPALISH